MPICPSSANNLPTYVLNGIQIALVVGLGRRSGKRREPSDRKPSEHCLDALPARLLDPPRLLLLELLDAGLVGPDCLHLGAEHDGGEDGKQQRLEDEEQQQHDHGGWRVCGAVLPLASDTRHKLVDG